MASFKFIHAADMHLDSPLLGLERYEGAPVERLRRATRDAFENLVQLCIDERVQFLLIAGDLYDGDSKDYRTGLYLTAQMAKLRKAGIDVYVVRGNHDAASVITKDLQLPENVKTFSTRKAQTIVDEKQGIAIHGRSYARRDISDDLSLTYPDPIQGLFNIGLLHTNVGSRPGHDNYAPSKLDNLTARGYQYWALGHVHGRQVLNENPRVVYSGNTQGRHVNETGVKGCELVTVEDGSIVNTDLRALDVVRWHNERVDLSSVESSDEAVALIGESLQSVLAQNEGRVAAIRLTLTGRSAVHGELNRDREKWREQVRAIALDVGADDIWVENIRFETEPTFDLKKLSERDDALGSLLCSIERIKETPEELDALAEQLAPAFEKLPFELKDMPDCFNLAEDGQLSDLLAEAGNILIPLLLEKLD
jgi:DNA repair exonuclease SbcCD nuclease subunit